MCFISWLQTGKSRRLRHYNVQYSPRALFSLHAPESSNQKVFKDGTSCQMFSYGDYVNHYLSLQNQHAYVQLASSQKRPGVLFNVIENLHERMCGIGWLSKSKHQKAVSHRVSSPKRTERFLQCGSDLNFGHKTHSAREKKFFM